ncbi:MAG: phosphoethanolamine transferase CptA [Cycloclasticus sp.]|nr:phosphoethanolamine transferase CptA [Cycloclasticus sp.]
MKTTFNWRAFRQLYFFFFFFSGPYQIAIYLAGMSNTTGIRDAILMSSVWMVPVLLWPKHTRAISAVIGVLLWATSIVSWSYFYVFGQDFSQSVLFIIFESNMAESNEFIESYISPAIIALLFVYAAMSYALWRRLEPVHIPHRAHKYATIFIFSFIFSWPLVNPLVVQSADWDVSIKKMQDRIEPAAPWNIIAGYFKYQKVLGNMQRQLANNSQIAPLKELQDTRGQQPSTMVIVMGESTNAQRMSLYGYQRPTSPLLDEMKDELYVFDNVISPRPYTIEALQQILTFGDQQNPDDYLSRPTLMNMMQQAGYKSFWITNQQTQTKRNTMLLTFSQQTDEQVYLNNNRVQNAGQFDEEVLEPFEQALSDPAEKKLIIVHLIGTHRKYEYRYPESFDHFTSRQGVPDWLPEKHLEEYNAYDNAVLYNDYVVSSLVKQLKAKVTSNSALVYFADHGEEVFDTKDHLFTGRNEGKPTVAMYRVPFITWLSPALRAKKDLRPYLNRPYLNSDFIHSWTDLADIRFSSYDSTKSLFNPDFIARKRLIGNPATPKKLIDFDMLTPTKTQLVAKN